MIEPIVGKTSGDKDALSMVLYSLISNVSSHSTPEAVRKPSVSSLSTMGRLYPVRVLGSLLDAFERQGSPSVPLKDYASPGRVNLLKALDSLLSEGHVILDSDKMAHRPLIGRLISLMILEMTRVNDIVHDVQNPCAAVLTSLSRQEQNVDRVIDNITTKLEQNPHYIIIYTIGSIASINPRGMVPYLKNILPILVNNVKSKVKDSHKFSYANTFLKCSEAILDYMASRSDKSVTKEDFVKEMDTVHELFFSNWLTGGSLSRDSNMRNSILMALASMFPLLSVDRMEKNTIPMLNILLSLYKKLPEPYYISHCISQLLASIEGKDTDVLESIIESILNSLFQQVNMNIDHSKPMAAKNQNEVFRCYDVLAASPNYNGKLIEMLLARLSGKEESSCVKSMLVLRHLLNSNINKLSDRLDDIISSLYIKLTDPSIQVRKALAQLTVLLGNAGYLKDEVGKEFIQFIVHQTAVQCEDNELADMCDSILKLLVNGQSNFLLWPYLLDYLYLPEYLNATPSLVKTLSLIVDSKLRNEGSNLRIDFDKLSHLRGSYSLFSRLLVLSAFPFDKSGGFSSLELTKNLVPLIHSRLPAIWDKKVPLLQHYAETINSKKKCSDWDQEQWENWLLALLEDSIAEIDHDEWTTPLVESFAYQLNSFYKNSQDQRSFIIKCLGISIKKSGVRLIVLERLSDLFMCSNHALPQESDSCAKAFGQVSLSHPDLVLDKLETIFKNLLPKSRSGGLLNYFLRGDNKAGDENRFPKQTIYACLTEMASVRAISSEMSNSVVATFIIPALKSSEPSIKLEGIRSLSSLAGSPDILELEQTVTLLNTSIHCIKEKDFPDRAVALKCALRLLQISKELPDNFKRDLLDACFKFAMPNLLKVFAETKDDFEEYCLLFKDIITTTMKFDMEQSTLDELFTRLEDYLKRENDIARELGSSLLLSSVITYLDNVTFRIGAPTTFAPGPYMIGSLVPRCFDGSPVTRANAIASLDVVLKILCLYEGRKLPKKEECFLPASLAYDADLCCKEIISVLSSKISYDHMFPFCHSIIEGVLDKIGSSALGTSSVLLGLMEERGREMFSHAPSLALKIHEKLIDVGAEEILGKLFKAIHVLMEFNTRGVIESLLTVRHQNDEMLGMIWKKLPLYDSTLTTSVINYLIDVIHVDVLTKEEMSSQTRIKVVETLPMAAINALGQMFQVALTEDSLGNSFGEILVPLTLALGSTVGASFAKAGPTFSDVPYKLTQTAITSFLSCKNHNVLASLVENGGAVGEESDPDLSFNDVSFITFLKQFTSLLVEDFSHQVSKLIANFEPFLNHLDPGKSLSAVVFYSALLSENGVDKAPLAEKLMNRLTENKDEKSDSAVKIIILRGLTGYKVPDSLLLKLLGTLADLVDNDDPAVVFHALDALRCVMSSGGSSSAVIPLHILSTLGLKVRPFFDSGGNRLGEVAMRLFACIVDFHDRGGSEDYAGEVTDQIRGVLTSVLLHANDESSGVKSASLEVASRIGQLISTPTLSSEYSVYLNQFVEALSLHESFKDMLPIFATNTLSYFSSPKPQLRINAIILLLSLTDHSSPLGDMADNICKGLDKLLNDKDQDVRVTASLHLGSICLNLFKNQEL